MAASSAGPTGSPGVDQEVTTTPDQVGVDGLAGDAAACRHDDPRDLGREGLQPRPGRVDPGSTARGSPRSTERARAAAGSRSSAPTCRSRRGPWRPGRQPGSTRRVRPLRHLRRRPARRWAARRRRTWCRIGAAGSAASPSARAGRAGPSEAEDRAPRRSRQTLLLRRQGPIEPPRSPAGTTAESLPPSASRIPASSKSSRIAATCAASAASGVRSPPNALAASDPDSMDRAARSGSVSAASTRPPGKTCMSAAKAIDDGRWVSSTSSPVRPARSRTTVAAGCGTTEASGIGRRSVELRP